MNFWQGAKNVSLNVRNSWKKLKLFPEKLVFLKFYLWTLKIQFCKPCLKKFAGGTRSFRSTSEKDEKFSLSEKELFLKSSSGQVEGSFSQVAEKFLTKGQKFFAQRPQMSFKILQLAVEHKWRTKNSQIYTQLKIVFCEK